MKKGSTALGPMAAGVIVGEVHRSTVRKAASAGADIIEVRVDTFEKRDPEVLRKAVSAIHGILPLLITVRNVKEGGRYRISDKERVEIFEALMPFADFVDVELSSGGILKNVIDSARRNRTRVILSYHNFKSTPGAKTLHGIVEKAKSRGADIVKVATLAKDAGDLRKLAKILSDFNDLIVIGMGGKGSSSRVFFPMIGSLLTYGSITGSTAPGQLTLREIKKEFKRYGF